MNTGVVISSYNMPSAVDLQATACRHFGRTANLLIVDDHSERSPQVQAVARNHGATCWTLPRRVGHYVGAMSAYWFGLQWAYLFNLDAVAVLSQRFIIIRPDWLAEAADLMTGAAVLYGVEGPRGLFTRSILRTEAVMFSPRHWIPGHLQMLFPQQAHGHCIETYMLGVVDTHAHPRRLWPLLGSSRLEKNPDWITHHERDRAEYESLANGLGVPLGNDFFCGGFNGKEPIYMG